MNNSSTLGYEKACNPWLKMDPFESWHENLMKDAPAIPQYFPLMKQMNVKGPKHHNPDVPLYQVDLHDASELAKSHIIIDVRPYEIFSEAHIKGSINIPLMPAFPLWAGTIIPHDKPLILVGDSMQACIKAIELLQLVGIDRVEAFCDANLWGFPHRELEPELTTMPLIEPAAVAKKSDDLVVVDVRSPSEWRGGHIPHAHHMELSALPYGYLSLPKDKNIALICRSGSRASLAASYLRKMGFQRVCNVHGGMVRMAPLGRS